ncbi:cytochrome P450 [Xylariaceae sp. FL1651]|nr:cytochrome P450 [Xylariaceae sp. FL1651]
MARSCSGSGFSKISGFLRYIEIALALPAPELEKLSKSDKDFTFLHSIVQYTRDSKVLRDQLVAILIAGRDTSAATLSWTIYELSRCPDEFHRLRGEIPEALGGDRIPTYEDLKNMVYLRRVLNETLRLYPAVPYNLRTALRDSTLDGAPGKPPISVAEGDVVIYTPLSMQRRKNLHPPISETFEDPTVFSPERWEYWTPRNNARPHDWGADFHLLSISTAVPQLLAGQAPAHFKMHSQVLRK